jgi:hypothetical protein
MKIRSLLLGSIAAAGLATGAQAADLAKGVLTSLDVCDNLGLAGLTISSDSNCLQITGGVSYMFAWGDYKAGADGQPGFGSAANGAFLVKTPDDTFRIPAAGDGGSNSSGRATDWDTQMIAWLQVVGTASSDFGPAQAVIKLKSEQYRHTYNGYGYFDGDDTGGSTNTTSATSTGSGAESAQQGPSGTVLFDRAYVSVGDSTVLTAGKTGSIVNTDDDTPLNWLGLFNSDNVGTGVLWSVQSYAGGHIGTGTDNAGANVQTGGHSIQVTSSLGNGITLKGAIEDLNDTNASRAGTAIGVISYAGDNLTAHLSVLETGILDGHADATAYHAGFTGTFDKFKIVAAIAGDSSGYWDGLASAQATFDMFKLAASVEGTHDAATAAGGTSSPGGDGLNGLGFGGSASLTVSDGITINLGGRYFDTDTATTGNEAYQVAASLVAAVTETITLTGEIGVYGSDASNFTTSGYTGGNAKGTYGTVYYGAAQVAWAPGGGFTSSLKGEAYSNGAYKATFNAAKNFQ